MNVSRRGLLGMFAAAAAAPYIPAGILMPVRKIIVPSCTTAPEATSSAPNTPSPPESGQTVRPWKLRWRH